jgi:hypothetical protein
MLRCGVARSKSVFVARLDSGPSCGSFVSEFIRNSVSAGPSSAALDLLAALRLSKLEYLRRISMLGHLGLDVVTRYIGVLRRSTFPSGRGCFKTSVTSRAS